MRILFVHNNYASNNSGEEHASQGLANLLTRNGHDVRWYRKSSDTIKGSLTKKIKAFFLGIYNPYSIKELKNEIIDFNPDIIQVQNLYPFISPAILPMINKMNIPVVMRCPNYRLFCPNGLHLQPKGKVCEKCLKGLREINAISNNCEKNYFKSTGYALRNFIARKLWKLNHNMDGYIVQSRFQKQKFIDNGIDPKKLYILPGLTPKLTTNQNSEIGYYVSFVGRVSVEKGIIEFLNVAKELPEVKFAVVGTFHPSLKYLKLNSTKNVLWTGFLSGKKLDEFYQKSKIIVVPSKWYEGFPNVITRAMKHGKPVVSSNLGAMKSIIDHNNDGILVDPGNIEQLKIAIKELYHDDKKCIFLGSNGKNKAKKNFDNKVIYKKLIETYKNIIKIKIRHAI